MAGSGCQPGVAAPYTSRGAVTTGVTMAEARWGEPLWPSHQAVPADRRLPREGSPWRARPVGAGAGAGSHTGRGATRAAGARASARVPSTPRAMGAAADADRGGPRRRPTGRRARVRQAEPRGVQGGRRRTRSAPSRWRPVALAPAVGRWRRSETVHASGCVRGSRLAPEPRVSPRGPEMVAPPAGGASPTPRPRNRRPGGGRSRWWCWTCPRAGRRLPGHPGLGTPRRHHPARVGRGRCRGWRRAARGAASGGDRARLATATRGWRPGVGRPGAGAAFRWRGRRPAPAGRQRPTDRLRACRSRPPSTGGGVGAKRRRSPPLAGVTCPPGQATTGGGGGAGLHQYQPAAADALQRHLRSRFQPRA